MVHRCGDEIIPQFSDHEGYGWIEREKVNAPLSFGERKEDKDQSKP
jgi:hypothetical protein